MSNIIYGSDYSDSLGGTNGDDMIFGFDGFDGLQGYGGLDGGTGVDVLDGGEGNDFLRGNAGGDVLTGGTGYDTFDASFESFNGLTSATSDTITDFTSGVDWLWVPGAGTYSEIDIGYGAGYDAALATANASDTGYDASYVFVSDGVSGYLFGDTIGDASMDFGIELAGLSSTAYFDPSDLFWS